MAKDKKIRIIISLLMFSMGFITYLLTVAPTLSFWDCGEFIACANILGVPHPPGTPFYMLLGRTVILALFFFEDIGFRMNLLSVFASAAGVMFGFLFTEKLIRLTLRFTSGNFISYCGGIVAASLIGFSDTYWFNAVESEIYSPTMAFLMLISWLSLQWVDHKDNVNGERILLLICYLAFLGLGLSLYTVLTMPAFFIFMLLVDPKTKHNYPLIVTGVLLMSIIYMVGSFVSITLFTVAVMFAGYLISSSSRLKKQFNFSLWLGIIALIGYSTHAYIPIRSSLNPRIDENNPEFKLSEIFNSKAKERYKGFIERKQYGSESMIKRAMHRRGELWNQFLSHPHMGYGGYMLSQYLPWKVGEGTSATPDNKAFGKPSFTLDDDAPQVIRFGYRFPQQMEFMPPYTHRHWQILTFLSFHVLMLWGAWKAYKTNRPYGVYMFVLYVSVSAGLIFYLNLGDGVRPDLEPYRQWVQMGADPARPPANVHMEVRERDYFYGAAYMFMGVFFGLSTAFLLLKMQTSRKAGRFMRHAGVALAILSMAVPCFSNLKERNRSGLWVPNDYARNLLSSCRPNSILFTNGDNDTFPLWYIQEVENFRKDVRVVNLSLGNTDWYIHQLLEQEPKVVLGFTHEQIDLLTPQINSLEKPVEHRIGKTGLQVTLEGRDKKPYYKVQDVLVMNIVQNNYPRRPIHFAVTVSNPNMMGLEKYMVMEGMVYTLTNEIKNQELNPERTAYLVDSVYGYRGLMDRGIYLNSDTRGLLSNYFATNHRLARWAQERIAELDKDAAALNSGLTSDSLAKASPDSLLNIRRRLDEITREKEEKLQMADKYISRTGELMPWDWRHYYFGSQLYRSLNNIAKAEEFLLSGLELGKQKQAFSMQLGQLYSEQSKFEDAEKIYLELLKDNKEDFQLLYALSDAFEKQEKYSQAKDVLTQWLASNSQHQYAQFISRKIQEYEKMIPAQPPFSSEKEVTVPGVSTDSANP